MSVRRMLAEVDSHEISEWIAYANVEPWGEERADLRAGIIASTIANIWRGKGQRPFSATDFMPRFEPRQQKTSLEVLGAWMKGMALAMGKVIDRKTGKQIEGPGTPNPGGQRNADAKPGV